MLKGTGVAQVHEHTGDAIPVLDVGRFLDGDPLAVEPLARQLADALERVGFFFTINHGVDWGEVSAVYDMARTLHALPDADKSRIAMESGKGGYLPFGGGTSYASDIAGEVRTPNQNAAYFVHVGSANNRWPDIAGFRNAIDTYIDSICTFARSLLPLYARALDLDEGWFDPNFDKPSATLRMSHYPVVEYGEHDWGLAPHTDSSFMTLLPANDVPGLQIRPDGDDWIEPPDLPQSFLINSGDILKRWTNDRFLSTAHRVRNLSGRDRYAMPFFFGARTDAVVEAIPTCVDDERPVRYEPITYGDYQRWFFNRNYEEITGEKASEAPP